MVRVTAVYDRIGGEYARFRRPDPRISAQIERALGDAACVLNVGAGTGSYESTRTRCAVEPSAVMVSQRPPGAPPAVRSVAARLPFADATFDAATAAMTIHHWPDAGAGLAEVRRVTAWPIVVFAWDSSALRRFWLIDEYAPAAAAHDAGLVDAPQIAAILGRARIEVVPVPHDCTDGFLGAYWRRPERYLDRGAVASISGLALLEPASLAATMARLGADLESGAWHRRHADLLDRDELDCGYRLIVANG